MLRPCLGKLLTSYEIGEILPFLIIFDSMARMAKTEIFLTNNIANDDYIPALTITILPWQDSFAKDEVSRGMLTHTLHKMR